MNAIGTVTITTEETKDELRFRIERHPGWLQKYVAPAVLSSLIPFLLFPFRRMSYLVLPAALFLGILACVAIMRRVQPFHSTTLSVTKERFQATGDGLGTDWAGSRNRPGQITIPVAKVRSYGYSMGSEYDPSGFWVSGGSWINACLLPGLNRRHATAVAIAIARRFPEIGATPPQFS